MAARRADFDRLLWSSDLSVVRGEDSLVRALWAGAPFVWQLYPQHDGAHLRKLQAFARALAGRFARRAAGRCRRLVALVECDPTPSRPRWPPLAPWRDAVHGWREHLAAQSDLCSRLLGFVAGKR